MCAKKKKKKPQGKFSRINHEKNAYCQEKVQHCWKLCSKSLSKATATTEWINCKKLQKSRAIELLCLLSHSWKSCTKQLGANFIDKKTMLIRADYCMCGKKKNKACWWRRLMTLNLKGTIEKGSSKMTG